MGEIVELSEARPPAWAIEAAKNLKLRGTNYGDAAWLVKFAEYVIDGPQERKR